jgi:uncharacterized protein DUF6065/EryCIII-like glycosyltransferase
VRTVLLAWELGRGFGHIVRLRRIAERLKRAGIRLVAAVPSVSAGAMLLDIGIETMQAPLWPGVGRGDPRGRIRSSATLFDTFAGLGLADPVALTGVIAAWRALFALLRPDLVIADYAPGAMLASRGLVPLAAVGTGFYMVPPELERFPLLHRLAPPVWDEDKVLATVNEVLARFSSPPLDRAPAMYGCAATAVTSFPLLDPYRAERKTPADGPFLDVRPIPRRPDAGGIFCYLSRGFEIPDDVPEALAAVAPRLRLIAPDLDAGRATALKSAGATILPFLPNLAEELSGARLVVHFGGAGLAGEALTAGVPQLVLSRDIEKDLTGQALAEAGAGRMLMLHRPDVRLSSADIETLAADDTIATRAAELGEVLRAVLVEDPLASFERDCLKLLGVKRRRRPASRDALPRKPLLPTPTPTPQPPRLLAYSLPGREPPLIVPAPLERDWMDRSPHGFAYRCLPLNIANAHGWLILNGAPFVAEWDGRVDLDAVSVRAIAASGELLASSHFGSGILTFRVGALFRTDPGYDLLVTGPINQPKDAIQPLTGVVETDWTAATFTMNWKFTRKGVPIAFEQDEPFCMVFPIRRGLIESIDPEIRSLAADPALHAAYAAFSDSRRAFNRELAEPGSEAQRQQWQKDYFRGRGAAAATAPPDHRTKLALPEFKRTD